MKKKEQEEKRYGGITGTERTHHRGGFVLTSLVLTPTSSFLARYYYKVKQIDEFQPRKTHKKTYNMCRFDLKRLKKN